MYKISVVSLGVLLLLSVACGDQDNPNVVQVGSPAALEQGTQPLNVGKAGLKAQAEFNRRTNLFKQIDTLKQKIVQLTPSADFNKDNLEKGKLEAELKVVHEQAMASIPGAGSKTQTTKVGPAKPIPAEKYAALKLQMKNFDMKNPDQVAAWAELKRKELGQ